MTLYTLIHTLEDIALSQPSINSADEGNIYEFLDNNPDVKYGAFIITQGTHYQDDTYDHYNLTLFFVDRLRSDMDSNRLQIQSHGKEVLSNILRKAENVLDIEYVQKRFTTFTQRFGDECAGCYVDVELESIIEINCAENYGE